MTATRHDEAQAGAARLTSDTYGLGVSLARMRSPAAARARVPVGTPAVSERQR